MFSSLFVNHIRVSKPIPDTSYLAHLPMVQNLKSMGGLSFSKPVTFLVGENGVGKSTLIEAIAVHMGFNPEGGTVNFNFSTEDSHSDLYRYLTISRGIERPTDGFFLRAESFYNFATNVDVLERTPFCSGVLDSYGGKSLHKQSHGESFLSLIENRFGGHGLYILDEPEAALSPMRLMHLMVHMQALIDDHSQFIISTHSPILMTFPDAAIYNMTEYGIDPVTYKETDHYQITKRFLDDPERMLGYLFK